MTAPVLVVHGGTGAKLPAERAALIRTSLRRACDAAYARLARESAVAAVGFAVERLEDDPLFNAGTGSVLQRDGKARLSASVMDGASGRFAACDAKLLSFAILGAVNWIPRWFKPDGPSTSHDVAARFADYLIAGLRHAREDAPR